MIEKMKKYTIKFLVGVLALFSLNSCENYLGGDTNIDPTRTSDASLNTLLPTVLFYTAQNTYANAFVSGQYTQQLGNVVAGGTDSQLRNEFGTQWVNLYLNVIPNCNVILKKAEESNSPHYAGIAKIVLAYNLGLAATTWENVPFTEADNNLTNLAPKYDSQEAIYATVQRLLTEAIADLGQTTSLFSPTTDDLSYRGDRTKWVKLANSLRARYLLHTAKKQGAAAYTAILASLQNGMTSNADDFQVVFNERNFNPWHSLALANNTGNLSVTFGGTFMDYMNGTISGVVDPRVALTANKTGSDPIYRGTTPGRGSAGSNTTFNDRTNFYGWFCRVDAPIIMMSYAETKFIESEVRFLQNGGSATSQGSTAAAYQAYLAGIKANMDKVGVSAANSAAFLAHPSVALGEGKLTLSAVLIEKYKALFTNPEAWVDLRRNEHNPAIYTGLELPENHNVELNGNWIARGVYPSSETSRNSEVAKANFKALDTKMWLFN